MLLRFFSFTGRASRQEFWFIGVITSVLMVGLFAVTISMVAGSVDAETLDKQKLLAALQGPGLFFLAGVIVLVTLPGYAVSTRRLHDRNKSGLWLSIFPVSLLFTGLNIASGDELIPLSTLFVINMLVGLASIWFTFELGFLKGTDGPNRFDSDPLSTKKIADEFAGSWADRPIEEISRSSSSFRTDASVKAVPRPRSRPMQATAPQGFGRRGLRA